jgi:hypothetical protein
MEPSRLSSIELVVPKDPRRPSPPDAKVEVAVCTEKNAAFSTTPNQTLNLIKKVAHSKEVFQSIRFLSASVRRLQLHM